MKKSLLFGLAAAIVLAGCTTNEEVMEVARYAEMNFSAFVDKTTKLVESGGSLNAKDKTMSVWGYKTRVNTTDVSHVFASQTTADVNDPAIGQSVIYETAWTYTPQRFWDTSCNYDFYAVFPYYPSTTCTPAGVINITEFYGVGNLGDISDLLVATKVSRSSEDIKTDPTTINFTFKHLLSKVNFKFSNSTTEPVQVDHMAINNTIVRGSCEYTHPTPSNPTPSIAWTLNPQGTRKYDYNLWPNNMIVAGAPAIDGIQDFLVIPQDVAATLDITYWIGSEKFSKTGIPIPTNNISKWESNINYIYTIQINHSSRPITFGDTKIEQWNPTNEEDDIRATTPDAPAS